MIEFICESNRIEGILRFPTAAEIEAHKTFLALDHIAPVDLEDFVMTVAGVHLRNMPGMNVRVGNHIAPPGGPDIIASLCWILERANDRYPDEAYNIHREYENLHPFMDGNGRSGRVLWLWMMGEAPLGFLHTWYYQSLGASRAKN